MKKILVFTLSLMMSLPAFAGIVDGKITKIRAYHQGSNVRFESRIPNLTFIVSKKKITRAMLKIGREPAVVKVEKNGFIVDKDHKVVATLVRRADGLEIRTPNHRMFVTEKELKRVR